MLARLGSQRWLHLASFFPFFRAYAAGFSGFLSVLVFSLLKCVCLVFFCGVAWFFRWQILYSSLYCLSASCKKRFLHAKQYKELKDSQCPIESCIRQSVLSVVRNVKFLSSLIRIGLFTAENAGKRKGPHAGDIKLLTLIVN